MHNATLIFPCCQILFQVETADSISHLGSVVVGLSITVFSGNIQYALRHVIFIFSGGGGGGHWALEPREVTLKSQIWKI